MPMYSWRCKKCARESEIINPLSESDNPPDENPEDLCAHKWQKFIAKPPAKSYGPGWRTRKGMH